MTVTEFLANLKIRGQYQAAQTVLTDSDYLRFANNQLQTVIAPKIMSLRDNYFSAIRDYSISTSSRRYRLPKSCMGGRIYSITIIDGTQQYQLQQMPNTDKSASARRGFYVSEGQFILTGDLPTGIMRVTYPCKLPEMSELAITYPITVVSTSSYTCPSISALVPYSGYTIIRPSSPYRAITTQASCQSGVVGNDAASSDYTRFAVGDLVISNGGTYGNPLTPYVPLQDQLCDWLLQRTHMRVLQALGHTQQMELAGSKLADIEKDIMAFMSPRVENSPKVIFGMQTAGWRD